MTKKEAEQQLARASLVYASRDTWESREKLCQAAKRYAAAYCAEKNEGAASSSAAEEKGVARGREENRD